jgi:putative ABC transport system ATP-binding protein
MVLAGLEPPTGGSVAVAGHDFKTMSEDDLARFRRTHIGIVFQSFHLVPTMTALENTALPLELAGEKECRARAAAILAEVGLADRHDHYPAQMSGGEQQRVALARVMVADPPVLFADEPTGNLDQATGESIMQLILNLAKNRQSTLFLITHDRALAEKCDRMLTMRDGLLD